MSLLEELTEERGMCTATVYFLKLYAKEQRAGSFVDSGLESSG